MQRQKGRAVSPRPHDDLLRYLKEEQGLKLERIADGWCWYWTWEQAEWEAKLFGEPLGEDWPTYRDEFLKLAYDYGDGDRVNRGFLSEGAAAVAALTDWMKLSGIHDNCINLDHHFTVINALMKACVRADLSLPSECDEYAEYYESLKEDITQATPL